MAQLWDALEDWEESMGYERVELMRNSSGVWTGVLVPVAGWVRSRRGGVPFPPLP